MSGGPTAEERIAQLLARGHAQRLAAGLAIYEARQQLAPLRSAVGLLGVAARAMSPGGAAAGVIRPAARWLVAHPWLGPALATGAIRLLRRRPFALLLAAATGAAAWWLLRPPAKHAEGPEPQG